MYLHVLAHLDTLSHSYSLSLSPIHLLVEIPQFGMVRSLNAHVSGALLVWEYVKQFFVKTRTYNSSTIIPCQLKDS